ncbi:MAG TPA: glycosyltransferase [Dissulfurispiraceae bacterium]|nr:glycosyltransferase [Dissulfurispiraceae bacterium]
MEYQKVSIIILNWNKLYYTQNCIASIEQCTHYPAYEIILFDNGSTEPGTDIFLSSIRHKVIRSPQNLGFAKGNNRAAEAAEGDLILFLNNDTVVHDKWLDAMVNMIEAYPKCGIVGSKLLYPDNTIQHVGVAFDHKGNCVHPFKRYAADFREALPAGEREAVTGACMLMRKEIFKAVGGFDEGYMHGSEDIDLCLKVRKLGLKVMYCPDSVVTHYEQISLKDQGSHYKKKTTRRNRKLFMRRWGSMLNQFRLPNDFSGMKPYEYYHDGRQDVAGLVPLGAKFILHIGCKSGMVGGKLKEALPERTVWGIEWNAELAEEAGRKLDKVIICNIENAESLIDSRELFDCIICDDVLADLRNPWAFLRNCRQIMADHGTLVANFPNIQYHKVIKDIVLNRWLYRAEGALAWEHLRFFSLATIENLLTISGYEISRIERKKEVGKILRKLNSFVFNRLDGFLTSRYMVACARRKDV